MSNLAFFAADTLGMELYQLKNGLESSEIRSIRLGAWQLDLPVDAKSDIISGTALSFWLTVNKSLHIYLIVREAQSQMFVLDAAALKMCGKASGFASETVAGRLEEIGPAIKGKFFWVDGHWNKATV